MRMKCESRLRHSAVLEPTNCGVTIRLGEFHLCRIYRKVHRRVLLWETIGKSNKRGTRRTTQESGARLCYANCGALTLFVFLWCKKSYRSGMHFSFESFCTWLQVANFFLRRLFLEEPMDFGAQRSPLVFEPS